MTERFVSFGQFDVDLAAGELRRAGRLIRLQHQPFEVLRALVARPNDVVTRDDLRERLWPKGVTVDFELGLNKSVTRLRAALGDCAANPRFVETLPKRGYRFIAPVFARDLDGWRLPRAGASVFAEASADKPQPPEALTALLFALLSATINGRDSRSAG
jgi:DNA-binding winged helix-turn-helix (wHTH) protein